MTITAKWNRKHGACYTDERLAALYDRPMTLLEVLTRCDGKWRMVSTVDRIWVFTMPGAVPKRIVREWMARILERLAAKKLLTDPRFLAVIPALRKGRVPFKARDAVLCVAHGCISVYGGYAYAAAKHAADDAACLAAMFADIALCGKERSRQLADAVELMRERDNKP